MCPPEPFWLASHVVMFHSETTIGQLKRPMDTQALFCLKRLCAQRIFHFCIREWKLYWIFLFYPKMPPRTSSFFGLGIGSSSSYWLAVQSFVECEAEHPKPEHPMMFTHSMMFIHPMMGWFEWWIHSDCWIEEGWHSSSGVFSPPLPTVSVNVLGEVDRPKGRHRNW